MAVPYYGTRHWLDFPVIYLKAATAPADIYVPEK